MALNPNTFTPFWLGKTLKHQNPRLLQECMCCSDINPSLSCLPKAQEILVNTQIKAKIAFFFCLSVCISSLLSLMCYLKLSHDLISQASFFWLLTIHGLPSLHPMWPFFSLIPSMSHNNGGNIRMDLWLSWTITESPWLHRHLTEELTLS